MRAPISAEGYDTFYLDVRGFIEGVEVPLSGVSFAYGATDMPTATLTVPASSFIRDLPETTKIHVFFKDIVPDPAQKNEYLWRLLFDGEFIGYSYSTDTSGATVGLTAIHTAGYLALMQLLTLDVTSQFKNPTANFAGDATIITMGAINRVSSTVIRYLQTQRAALKSIADVAYVLVKATMAETSKSDMAAYYEKKIGDVPGGYKILKRFFGISDSTAALKVDVTNDAAYKADGTRVDPKTPYKPGDVSAGRASPEEKGTVPPTGEPGKTPLLKQWDPRWADAPFGDGTVATSGCGPTAFAMVAQQYGVEVTPDKLALDYGAYKTKDGTSWDFFPAAGAQYGVPMVQTSDPDEALAALKAGKPVIGSHGPGEFTQNGHFVVYSYITPDGQVKVNDPNRTDTDRLYSWDFLVNDNARVGGFAAWIPQNLPPK